MAESCLRMLPSLITGVARRGIFGGLLLAIMATPAVSDLYAKEKRRVKAAREQKQAEAPVVKANEPVKLPGVDPNKVPESAPAKNVEKSREQDKSAEKPAEIPAGKPVEKAAEKSTDKSTDKPTDKPADKPSDKTADKPADKSPEKAADNTKVAKKVDEQSRPAVTTQPKPAIAPALEMARASRDAIRKIPGYTCIFSKQEQLKKGTPIRHTMSLKFRREPFSVYLKYLDHAAGREVIYVEGRNNGKLQVHEASGFTSLLGTINLLPTSSEALKENKYPVTLIGMEKMLEPFIADWEASQKDAGTKVMYYPQAKLGEIDCTMYEVAHPEKREPFKFHKSRVYFDKKTLLPIRAEQYAFPSKAGEEPQLVEEYTYSDVKLDGTPTETDFDVKNENYGFK